jgi:alanine racemase
MPNTGRAVAYINLGILEENYRKIREKLSPNIDLLCVVKANAYGHGAVEVCRHLESLGVSYFGVATIDEGIELRTNEIRTPILIMSGVMPWDTLDDVIKFHLTPVVYDFSVLKMMCSAVKGFQRPLQVHLKLDTGMGRLGFMRHEITKVMEFITGVENLHVDGLMSHFTSSEIRDTFGENQIERFKEIIDAFHSRGFRPKYIHMANSSAILNYPESHFTMVRAGISLYGSHNIQALKKQLPTRQVMKFVSKVALIKEFPAGSALSYGRTYITKRQTRVAYVPVGYADGYPRSLSNVGYVFIGDKRSDIIGRICMDWFLVDVTDHSNVNVQDEVMLIGESGTNAISADEIGELAGTIPYEILCNISKRVTRVYI